MANFIAVFDASGTEGINFNQLTRVSAVHRSNIQFNKIEGFAHRAKISELWL